MTLLRFVLPFLLCVAAGSTFAATPAQLADELDAAFAAARTPGAAIAVLEDGEVTLLHGIGHADVAAGTPATPETVFRAGSVAKSVLGVVVMQLVEEGRLSLDDRVSERARWLRFDNPWEATAPLRIVHLLEHTSGWADLSPREFALDDPALDLVAAVRVGGLRVSRYPPGRYHAYTSAGPAIVGRIVEEIEGRPFADVARDRVFAPLGMTSASFDLPPGLARSYLPDGSAIAAQRYPLTPAAGLVLDVADLARFARFMLDGRADDGRALLTPASLARIERSETTLAAGAGLEHGYGLGNTAYIGEKTVFRGHGGSIDGFEAEFRYERSCRCGFALLANGGDLPPAAIAALERHLTATREAPPASTATADPADAAHFAGLYQPIAARNRLTPMIDGLTMFARASVADDGRVVFDGVARELDGRDRLRRPDRAAPTLVFVDGDDGMRLLGATSAYRRVQVWTVWAKAAWALAFVAVLLLAVGWLVVAGVRRQPTRMPAFALVTLLPLLLLLGLFVYANALPSAQSIALFGRASWLSVAIACVTWMVPISAISGLLAAWRERAASRRALALVLAAAVIVAVAAIHLARFDWIGLSTWRL